MKTKKTLLNFITDTIPLVIISLLGIFKSKLFLQVFGDEILGLYNLFSQIMTYVALVDGGLSSAVLYSLYKPNAEGNQKKFNALIAGAFKTFSFIGMAVFGIAGIVSFFVPFLIKNCSFDYWYVILSFMLFALSSTVGYFFVPFTALLEVKEKKYIYNLTYQLGQIALSITEIIMLKKGFTFEAVLFMHSIVRLIAYTTEALICKKQFPEVKFTQSEKDYGFKKHIKSLVFHKINGLVGSNIDSIIISSMIGLKEGAIYSTYNYIVNMLRTILGKIEYSMTAIVGNELAKDKTKAYKLFQEFDSMLFFIATIICVPLALAINGFIDIWYEGEIATNMLLAIACSTSLFITIVKMDTTLFVSAGGLYAETRYCALTDTTINLILSFALIKLIGVPGVIFATAISVFVAEYILKTIVVHQNIFMKSSKEYFIRNIKFFVICVVDLILGYIIMSPINLSSIITWFVVYVIYFIFNAVLVYIVYRMFKETQFSGRFINLFKQIIMKGKKG